MVGTRNHPRDFPAPTESPTKRTTRASSATTSSSSTNAKDTAPALPKPSTNTTASPTKPRTRRTNSSWQHAPPLLALPWLAISLPLVIWDTGYIMLRPHTLPGGSLHWPLYAPYELYGRVDPVYSPGAYHASLGWTGAQGLGNAFETLAYAAYMWIVLAKGRREEGEGVWWLGGSWVVEGWWGPVGALVGYTTFAVTMMKSVLYCKCLWIVERNLRNGLTDSRA